MSNTPSLTPQAQTAFLAWSQPLAAMLQNTLEMLLEPDWSVAAGALSGADIASLKTQPGLANGAMSLVLMTQDANTLDMWFGFCKSLTLSLASKLMGAPAEGDLTDLHLGALSETLSQLLASLTSELNQKFGLSISVTPPSVTLTQPNLLDQVYGDQPLVALSLTVSHPTEGPQGEILHFLPQSVATQLGQLLGATDSNNQTKDTKMDDTGKNTFSVDDSQLEAILAGVSGMTSSSESPAAPSSGGVSSSSGPVTVSPVEFASFDNHISASGGVNKNLELVMDVCLNLTVELGRSELPIKSVLELTRGSVIELNRIAGESVDLYANGKMIAKGEVVVIEDNFGLRITSIVSPADRLRGL